jgi:hypothetical protein
MKDLEGVGVRPKGIHSMSLKDKKIRTKGMSRKIRKERRRKEIRETERGMTRLRRIGNKNRRS